MGQYATSRLTLNKVGVNELRWEYTGEVRSMQIFVGVSRFKMWEYTGFGGIRYPLKKEAIWLEIWRKRQIGYTFKERGKLAVNLKKNQTSRDYSPNLSLSKKKTKCP